jgi:hypothetical protein
MQKTDVVVTATWDWPLYLQYVSDDYQVLGALYIAQTSGKQAVRPALAEQMTKTWREGGHVYVLDYFKPEDASLWQAWITPMTDLTSADFDAYPRRFAWRANNRPVWELLPPEQAAATPVP